MAVPLRNRAPLQTQAVLHDWGLGGPGPQPHPLDLGQLTYLVVDDNRFERTLIRNCLWAKGLKRVIEAEDAIAALQMLETKHVDLAVVDYAMPALTGIDFTLTVRRGGPEQQPELPIILVSGCADTECVIEAREAGVHEFLAKPFSPDTLYQRIRTTLFHPRPFVRTEDYVGPDRRRFEKGARGRERRKT